MNVPRTLPLYLMSAAQHALGIDEVLRLVLGNIPPRSSECVWSADNPRWLHHWHPRPCFLPTAALVNKQWLEAALDYMWADIEAEELADNILRKRFLRRQVRATAARICLSK